MQDRTFFFLVPLHFGASSKASRVELAHCGRPVLVLHVLDEMMCMAVIDIPVFPRKGQDHMIKRAITVNGKGHFLLLGNVISKKNGVQGVVAQSVEWLSVGAVNLGVTDMFNAHQALHMFDDSAPDVVLFHCRELVQENGISLKTRLVVC